MAKTSFSTNWNSRNDTEVRAWITEYHDMLDEIGLVQTTDSGQIDIPTVTYGTNQLYGYEIWRWDDALQGTAPIFLRIEYRQGGTNVRPLQHVLIGTGSNGSGTLTNSTAIYTGTPGGTTAVDTNYATYACMIDGALGIAWKVGATHGAGLFIERTVDGDGDPTGEGAITAYRIGTSVGGLISVQFDPSFSSYSAQSTNQLIFNPMGATGANVPADELLLAMYRLPGGPPRACKNFVYAGNGLLNTGETALADPLGFGSQAFLAAGRIDAFGAATDTNSQLLIPWED